MDKNALTEKTGKGRIIRKWILLVCCLLIAGNFWISVKMPDLIPYKLFAFINACIAAGWCIGDYLLVHRHSQR